MGKAGDRLESVPEAPEGGRKNVARGVSPWGTAERPTPPLRVDLAAATSGKAGGCGGEWDGFRGGPPVQGLTPLATSDRPCGAFGTDSTGTECLREQSSHFLRSVGREIIP